MTKIIKILDIDFDNINKTNIISMYLVSCLDDVIRPLVLILPKMKGYAENVNDANDELMSFCVDEEKL